MIAFHPRIGGVLRRGGPWRGRSTGRALGGVERQLRTSGIWRRRQLSGPSASSFFGTFRFSRVATTRWAHGITTLLRACWTARAGRGGCYFGRWTGGRGGGQAMVRGSKPWRRPDRRRQVAARVGGEKPANIEELRACPTCPAKPPCFLLGGSGTHTHTHNAIAVVRRALCVCTPTGTLFYKGGQGGQGGKTQQTKRF